MIKDDKHHTVDENMPCKWCKHPRHNHFRGAGTCGRSHGWGSGCDSEYDDCLCGTFFSSDPRIKL